MPTYTSILSLQQAIEKGVTKAVDTTCKRLLGTLQQFIDEGYYGGYEPEYYKRTNQFYSSAISRMVGSLTGEILMDAGLMSYKPGWTGEAQIESANKGLHGGWDVGDDSHYWTSFIEFCDNNAENILKEELRKNGINVK